MRKLLVFLGATVGLLWVSVPAHADNASDAVAAFNGSTHVYNAPDSGLSFDAGQVNAAIGNRPIYYAMFGNGTAKDIALAILDPLAAKVHDPVIVVLVKSSGGGGIWAYSHVFVSGQLGNFALSTADAHASELNAGNATSTLTAFASGLQQNVSQVGSSTGNSAASNESSGAKSSHVGLIVLVCFLVLGVVAVGGYMVSRRRTKRRELADLRAGVISLYDRLGADVSNLDAKDNTDARQALADASERYTAAGSQLAQADSPVKYEVARRTAIEGLYAARTAREKLGLPLGADLPAVNASSGDTLSEPTTVNVKGQDIRGYPDYQPGAPYYYGGGGGYGAGWYSMPFWETLLLTSALSGGFGGGWGWGGGGGFDSGYRDGYQDAQQDSQGQGGDSGADWGGGGGDWGGGGGGDWGGGGGDWGGGGGDWGGGDGGGGSW